MLGAPDLPLPPGNPPSQFPLGIPVGCIIAYAGEVEGAASSPPPPMCWISKRGDGCSAMGGSSGYPSTPNCLQPLDSGM